MAIIPAALAMGLVSGAVSAVGSGINTAMQNQANKDLWREQTEYNTPTNQMTRLREAGLNPALAYGKGVSTNVASSPPSMQRSDTPDVATDISATQQIENFLQQNKNLKVQEEILKNDLRTREHDNAIYDKVPNMPSNLDPKIQMGLVAARDLTVPTDTADRTNVWKRSALGQTTSNYIAPEARKAMEKYNTGDDMGGLK